MLDLTPNAPAAAELRVVTFVGSVVIDGVDFEIVNFTATSGVNRVPTVTVDVVPRVVEGDSGPDTARSMEAATEMPPSLASAVRRRTAKVELSMRAFFGPDAKQEIVLKKWMVYNATTSVQREGSMAAFSVTLIHPAYLLNAAPFRTVIHEASLQTFNDRLRDAENPLKLLAMALDDSHEKLVASLVAYQSMAKYYDEVAKAMENVAKLVKPGGGAVVSWDSGGGSNAFPITADATVDSGVPTVVQGYIRNEMCASMTAAGSTVMASLRDGLLPDYRLQLSGTFNDRPVVLSPTVPLGDAWVKVPLDLVLSVSVANADGLPLVGATAIRLGSPVNSEVTSNDSTPPVTFTFTGGAVKSPIYSAGDGIGAFGLFAELGAPGWISVYSGRASTANSAAGRYGENPAMTENGAEEPGGPSGFLDAENSLTTTWLKQTYRELQCAQNGLAVNMPLTFGLLDNCLAVNNLLRPGVVANIGDQYAGFIDSVTHRISRDSRTATTSLQLTHVRTPDGNPHIELNGGAFLTGLADLLYGSTGNITEIDG